MTRLPRKKPSRLQDRDYELLEFVLRYRIATREILHRRFFDDSEVNAVTKVTSRLTESGFLARHPFIGTTSYFSLGLTSAKHFAIPSRCANALGLQSLLIQYGILEYCSAPDSKRNRFRVSELNEKHPQILQKGIESGNYVADATNETVKFQFVRVDGGGSADHVVRKIRQDIESRLTNPVCDALIKKGRFEIVCVTYNQEKEEQIRLRVKKENLPCNVETFVALNLFPLLGI